MLTASAASGCPTSPRSSAASAKAEFFVCLARAFQPMGTLAARASFARELAGDLADLAAEAGYDLGPLSDRGRVEQQRQRERCAMQDCGRDGGADRGRELLRLVGVSQQ